MHQSAALALTNFMEKSTQVDCSPHSVQFYESEEFLAEVVGRYIMNGLTNGEGVIIVATASHWASFEKVILDQGTNVAEFLRSGQLIVFNAREALASFMRSGLPDRNLFLAKMRPILAEIKTRFPKIRAFGEMVDLLRKEKNDLAVLALEQLWIEFSKQESMALFCAYRMVHFSEVEDKEPFREVCDHHTLVLPAESYWQAEANQREMTRAISLLQQQAQALQQEVKEHQKAEVELQEKELELRNAFQVRDEFVALASHELKTPLTTLKLQVQMAKRRFAMKGDSEGKTKGALGKMIDQHERQLDRLTKLIDDIIEVSRILPGDLQSDTSKMELNSAAREFLSRFKEKLASRRAW